MQNTTRLIIPLFTCTLLVTCLRTPCATAQQQAPDGDQFFVQAVQEASLVVEQPRTAPPRPPRSTRRRPSTRGSSSTLPGYFANYQPSESRRRLANMPDMFGDSFVRNLTLESFDPIDGSGESFSVEDIPSAGGGRQTKIGENNTAMPSARVYFTHNHFHNAYSSEFLITTLAAGATTARQDYSLDRYTFGIELPYTLGGLWSVELRLPVTGGQTAIFDADPGTANNSRSVFSTGEWGNAAAIFKRLIADTDDTALSVGCAVEAPTGSNGVSEFALTRHVIENEAVHVQPFIGLLHVPNDTFVFQFFAQLDVATNGNTVRFEAIESAATGVFGKYNEQTLLFLDASLGMRVYENPAAPIVTGIMSLIEVHYTTTLQNSDRVTGTRITGMTPSYVYQNSANRVDVVNLTTAFDIEVAQAFNVRIGGVFPLRSGDNRFFDGEVTFQFSRPF